MTARAEEETTYIVTVHRGRDAFKRGRNAPMRDYESWHDENGKVHRVNGPASLSYDIETGIAVREAWMRHGRLHRTDGPALISRDGATSRVISSTWYIDGEKVPPPKRTSPRKPPAPSPTG